MSQTRNNLLLLLFLAILAVVSLLTRNLIPVDETRYTTVAWEMWLRGDFLVPHLNGEPYSHKPPLLFWLIQLGWKLFGVNEWWPRLIPFIFSFGALLLVQQLGRRLWPATEASLMASFITLGFTLWAFFSTTVMFDMLLAFFVLLAIYGIFQAFSEHSSRWWLLVGLAWGLGVLSKGPVIFVHTLPLLFFARYWLPSRTAVTWKSVIAGILIALFIASIIIFAWVIPATSRGGEEYAQSLLFGQNVQRALKAPNDALAWWYYIAFMPFILFPWAYWGGNWKALKSNVSSTNDIDHGRRFCLAWIIPVLLLFTFISGKKVHYLLPVLPAVALYLSSLLTKKEHHGSNREMWPLTAIYLAIAVIIGSLPFLYSPDDPPYWVHNISIYTVIPFLALAIAGQFFVRGGQLNRVRMISLQTVILIIIAHFTIFIPASQGYDLRSIAIEIARLQEQDLSIAHNGKYRGEYHLLGRLKKPFDIVYDHTEQEWMNKYPDGYIIGYRYEQCGEQQEPVEYQRLFRNGQCVTIRTSAQQKVFLENRNKEKKGQKTND
jgi:4-amino-4-deoxy-L-arabinose transferase-like glycosyltransferase